MAYVLHTYSFMLFNIAIQILKNEEFLIFLVKVSLGSSYWPWRKIESTCGKSTSHAAVLPGSGDAGAAQPSSQVPVHSGFLSTAPFVGSLETKYVSARNGEWDSCLFPSCTHTLSLSKFVGNQISLGFQKYLSWSFGRIPSWWESAFSKKAGNKSPEDTGAPSHCITPVAKSRPLPSVASLFS